eukprot:maker-scaffold_29-snap-gene-4.3-mRNA-1 protein AED:0.01 eAED:0.01 QI:142/1/1/1/1/1/3/144/406
MNINLQQLSLQQDIRPALIRQEESIIFALIERSSFPLNKKCYENEDVEGKTLLNYFFSETEKLQAKLGRYTCEEELPYFSEARDEHNVLPRSFSNKLKANLININSEIKDMYLNLLLPQLCASKQLDDDEENYGSACLCDISVLQAISKRIHYGKFVAEAKFSANIESFSKLIKSQDAKGLMDLLTHVEVEKKVIERVRMKASYYGRDPTEAGDSVAYQVDPNLIAMLYEKYLIPLTKEVQVKYLLNRLNEKDLVNQQDLSSLDLVNSVLRNESSFAVLKFDKDAQELMFKYDLVIHSASWNGEVRKITVGKRSCSLEKFREGLNRAAFFFSTVDGPGGLMKVLKAMEHFNLKSLETLSSDDKTRSLFFCELDVGTKKETDVENCLRLVQAATLFFRPCGTYFEHM